MWHGEDQMEVADREQFLLPSVQPLLACVGLALRAVAVSAGVVRDGLVAAANALVAMAAERCRAAAPDGPQHLELLPAQMGFVTPDESVARRTDDVGHLQGGPLHRFFLSLERLVSWAL